MENTNMDNQPSQIKRNPTRFNTNVKEGKTDEKTFDSQTGQNRDVEINPAELDNDEINLDRSGIDTTPGNADADFSGREENNPPSGQIEGSSNRVTGTRQTESEISHKAQEGGRHASNLGNAKEEPMRRLSKDEVQREAQQVQKQAAKPGQGQTYGQKDREKIPSVDREGRIEEQNSQNRGMDQNRNGNQQGSQFNH